MIVVIALGVAANGGSSPTSPTPPPPQVTPAPEPAPPALVPGPALPGVLWVMVFSGTSGICLPEATVEVIVDGTVIQSGRQKAPCSPWDYGDEGILFVNLPVVQLTLRASAPGYAAGEITVTPAIGWYSVTEIALQPSIPSQSDFNGDGKPDLLWQHQGDGRLSVWLMNGLTQLSALAPDPPEVTDTAWKIVGTGDVDGDGNADVFWQNTTTGDLSLWTMNGLQLISGDPLVPSNAGDSNWRVRAVADVNHDGHPDLIWQHVTQGWVSVWTMTGRTMIEGHLLSPYAVDPAWQVVATGDLDQDGSVDLIWQHQTSGDLAWWRLDGYAQMSGAALSPGHVADLEWKIRGAADFDGDGRTDLVWQHMSDGAVAIWLMDGTALRSVTAPTTSSVTDVLWWIVGPK